MKPVKVCFLVYNSVHLYRGCHNLYYNRENLSLDSHFTTRCIIYLCMNPYRLQFTIFNFSHTPVTAAKLFAFPDIRLFTTLFRKCYVCVDKYKVTKITK